MSKNKLLASVIIPTYNYGRFISEAIESIFNQSFPQDKIEIIVIDDGSTDNTKEVAWRYKDKVKYIYQANFGKALTVKAGIEAACGRYIFNLDADDIFLPDKIRKVVNVFENDKDITHIAHPVIYWYADKNTKKEEIIPQDIIGKKLDGKCLLSYFYKKAKFYGGGSSFAARADALQKIPMIKKEIGGYIDEYMSIFVLNKGYSFFINEPLTLYRIHGDNINLKVFTKERVETELLASKAILKELKNNDFDKSVKVLYELKVKILEAKTKEIFGRKQFSDIVAFWLVILKNLNILGLDLFRIIRNYRVVQRSAPMFVVRIWHKFKEAGKKKVQ